MSINKYLDVRVEKCFCWWGRGVGVIVDEYYFFWGIKNFFLILFNLFVGDILFNGILLI